MNRFLLVSILAAASLQTGCSTIGNLGKFDRIMPQVQKLVVDQDRINQEGGTATVVLKGKDAEEEALLLAVARNMGWKVWSKDITGVTVIFQK